MNLEQFKLLNKIKISCFRHRGDAVAVAAELGLDLDLVRKYIKKLKGKDDKDVSSLVANTLMQHVFFGYESRVHLITEMLNSLDKRHQISVSDCCRHAVGVSNGNPLCLKCNNTCAVIVLDQTGIYELKLKLLEQLKEEDKTLVEFADKMGLTARKELPAPKFEDNRQIIVMGDSNVAKELSEIGPLEREALRLKLEKQIMDGIENTDGSSKKTV